MKRLLSHSATGKERCLGNRRALGTAMLGTIAGLLLTLLTGPHPLALLLANGAAGLTLGIVFLIQRQASRRRQAARRQLRRFYQAARKRERNGGMGEKRG